MNTVRISRATPTPTSTAATRHIHDVLVIGNAENTSTARPKMMNTRPGAQCSDRIVTSRGTPWSAWKRGWIAFVPTSQPTGHESAATSAPSTNRLTATHPTVQMIAQPSPPGPLTRKRCCSDRVPGTCVSQPLDDVRRRRTVRAPPLWRGSTTSPRSCHPTPRQATSPDPSRRRARAGRAPRARRRRRGCRRRSNTHRAHRARPPVPRSRRRVALRLCADVSPTSGRSRAARSRRRRSIATPAVSHFAQATAEISVGTHVERIRVPLGVGIERGRDEHVLDQIEDADDGGQRDDEPLMALERRRLAQRPPAPEEVGPGEHVAGDEQQVGRQRAPGLAEVGTTPADPALEPAVRSS